MFGADKSEIVAAALGAIRTRLGKELGLIDESKFNFLWVTDWPQFEFSEEEGRYVSAHHPFTMPKEEDVELLSTDPGKVYAEAYDIVLNGYELGGGLSYPHTRTTRKSIKNIRIFSRTNGRTVWLPIDSFRLRIPSTRRYRSRTRSFRHATCW